jgi:FixJ family two-component response regulator
MAEDEPIVYIVDDDLSVRQALSSVIRSTGLRVQTFASAQEFLDQPRAEAPACLVLDVMLPDRSGLDLPRELAAADVQIPIIFITGHGTIPMGVGAIKAGALEFLTKPFREDDLLTSVQHALDRDRVMRSKRAEIAALQSLLQTLTPREREVMALIVTGRMNKQIAAELGTAEQTIKQHRGRIMHKLRLASVADLVRFVQRAGGQPAAAPPPPAPAPGLEGGRGQRTSPPDPPRAARARDA